MRECPLEIKTEFRSKMLTIPKEISKKNTKRKYGKSSYFVISSDAAYREIVSVKEEKERRR